MNKAGLSAMSEQTLRALNAVGGDGCVDSARMQLSAALEALPDPFDSQDSEVREGLYGLFQLCQLADDAGHWSGLDERLQLLREPVEKALEPMRTIAAISSFQAADLAPPEQEVDRVRREGSAGERRWLADCLILLHPDDGLGLAEEVSSPGQADGAVAALAAFAAMRKGDWDEALRLVRLGRESLASPGPGLYGWTLDGVEGQIAA